MTPKAPLSVKFACLRCGECCRGQGGIWLTENDRLKAAAFLGLTPKAFSDLFLEHERKLWSVQMGSTGYCRLWVNGCRIQGAKPLMCQAWPFFYGLLKDEAVFTEAKAACPGLYAWDWARFKTAAPFSPPKSFKEFLCRAEGEAGEVS
ncbi:MAG: YkgJ family cysteine cluster protein [Deltaproteobacteria bacterium]|nr:YkgJ family cysteine cluster protein [Deltaproteobacteria bacterium]